MRGLAQRLVAKKQNWPGPDGAYRGPMKHIVGKEPVTLASLLCQRCGGLMRLVGSEPHPVEAKTDLLTYSCTACEELFVLPVAIPEADG